MVGALLVENVMALVVIDHITAHRIITIVIVMVIASRKKGYKWTWSMKKNKRVPEEYCSNCGKKITEAENSSEKCSNCGAAIIPVEVLLEDDFFMEGFF